MIVLESETAAMEWRACLGLGLGLGFGFGLAAMEWRACLGLGLGLGCRVRVRVRV